MPRYFFDIAEGETRADWSEVDLPDRELARQYALGIAETIMRNKVADKLSPKSLVIVRNDAGEIIEVIRSESF